MKRLITLIFLLVFSISWGSKAFATHIVGAELFYECVDEPSNKYLVTLKLYRDCLNGQAPFDALITLFVFQANTGNAVQWVPITAPSRTPQIDPNSYGPCVATVPSICVQEGIYQDTLILPPVPGGYDIGWARCCRNVAIDNLVNPLGEGITFLAHVPSKDEVGGCNSMPTFDQVPPIFLCANETFTFDHSATDLDGDSLVYALTNPYTGLNTIFQGAGNPQQGGNDPTVDRFNNPMGPPPYRNVVFANGFSFLDPFGSGNFSLDSLTGFINVTPNQPGIYVFSVSVFEYRNGVLLSENRRDFQIHVIPCLTPEKPPIIQHTFAPNQNTNGDTIIVNGGEAFCYDVVLFDSIPSDSVRTFTVSSQFGNGSFFPPAATWNFQYDSASGISGQVCWDPACQYSGQTISLIVGGRDPADCITIADVFDTVWVRILPDINQPPAIAASRAGQNIQNDTIVVNANDNLCYDLVVNDPDIQDNLSLVGISPIFSSANPPLITQSGTNPINAQLCWTPGCDLEGQVVELRVRAEDIAECKDSDLAFSSTFIRIEVPPNNPPALNTNLVGTVFSNDTIFVNAEDNFCFNFTSIDPNTGDTLSFVPVSPIFNSPGGPTTNTTGINPLNGQVCWTPGCNFENQVIPLIFGAEDQGQCSNQLDVFDTVYVSVQVPPNNAPSIASNLTNLVTNGDTIIIDANQNFCYNYVADDPNLQDILSVSTISAIFNQPNGPTFNTSGTNPVAGQICWTPSCDFTGQVIPLVLRVDDDAACSAQASDFDTVFVRVDVPPNAPPVAAHFLPPSQSNGDTIIVDAQEPFCYDVNFQDPNVGDSLTAFTVSPIFTGPNAPVFTPSGINPVVGQICWTPSCDDEGQLFQLIVGVEDNGQCNNTFEAFDTTYVRIRQPITLPPVVGHNISENREVRNDTIFIEVGDSACYDFFVADRTSARGVNYDFTFEDQFGNNLPITAFNVEQRNDSILGRICFFANCTRGGTTFRSIITGVDDAICPPFKQASDTIYIRVFTDFKSFAGRDTFFCEGTGGLNLGVTPIGGDAPYFYQWYCDDPGNCGFFPNGNQPNPNVNPNGTTTYSVQLTDANGCTSEFDDIEVNVAPLPIVDAGPDVAICEVGLGTRLNGRVLNDSVSKGPYTYNWFPSSGLSLASTNDPFARPDTTTIYTLVVTDALGCSSFSSTVDPLSTVTVGVKPAPVVEAGPDLDLCLGDTLTLTGFADNAGPNYDYIWTPSFGLNDSSSQSTQANPDRTTTYFLIAFSNGCRSVADSATVVVHTKPTVADVGPFEICALDTVQLKALAGGDPDASEYSFAWSPGLSLDDSTIANPKASPNFSTNYQLTATSNFGCGSGFLDVPVTVRSTPVIDLRSDTSICEGDVLTLNNIETRFGGATTEPTFYTWTPTTGLDDPLIREPNAAPTINTQYIITARTGACATQDTIFVEVFPKVEAIAFADTTRLCSNDSIQLSSSGGRGAATYEWSPAVGLSNPNIPNPMASPDTSITYTVTVTEGACNATIDIPLNVIPSPILDFRTSDATSCDEVTVFFQALAENTISYVWDFGDGSPISNEVNPNHTYSDSGDYVVTLVGTGTAGCQTIVQKTAISINPPGQADFVTDPPLNANLQLPEANISFINTSEKGVDFYWEFGDGGTSSEENPSHTYKEPGTYTVRLVIVDESGCISEVLKGTVTVELPKIFIPNVFSPNADGVNDTYRVTYTGAEPFVMEIFDRWGRAVVDQIQNPGEGWNGITRDGTEASEGVYYYVVRIGDRFYKGNLTLLR
ncbi:MAG: PKD domain-containing protein [Bacteroidia bacterium]|nr:PKD domain-containing protein [Bacteroidia bacterium]